MAISSPAQYCGLRLRRGTRIQELLEEHEVLRLAGLHKIFLKPLKAKREVPGAAEKEFCQERFLSGSGLCQEGILSGKVFVRKRALPARNFVRKGFYQEAGSARQEFCQEAGSARKEFCQEGIL